MSRKNLTSLLFFASSILVAVSWLWSDTFPDGMALDPAIAEPPRQVKVERDPFMVTAHDNQYRVRPLYDYEFTGLVVSFNRFEPGIGAHARWNDYINVADVCIVWGSNASDVDLNKMDFWNGEFTCKFGTGDRETWERFDPDMLSNNHLVTEDPRLQAVLDDLRVGDQIHVRGWLSEYGQPDGPMRGTSTTRTDSGNGACETIYLEDVRIIKSMGNTWRSLFWPGLAGLAVSLVLWFTTPVGALTRG